MSESSNEISKLIIKYLNDQLEPEEKQKLDEWRQSPENEKLYQEFIDPDKMFPESVAYHKAKKNGWERMKQAIPDLSLLAKVVRLSWKYIAAAGVVVLVAITFFHKARMTNLGQLADEAAPSTVKDIPAPTGTHSTLRLGNGKIINLDSAGNGALTTNVSKLKDGEIKYTADAEAVTNYSNTLTTARGGQTMLALEDGTKVWLNAASSITFPSHFTGSQRKVSVTGEAYLEVARSKNMPFVVTANHTEVTVLGTSFNVHAYEDEAEIKTTLINGAVRVSAGSANVVLKPGQQVRTGDQDVFTVNNTDLDQVMAWKNGDFRLDGNLTNTLRELERWYDIKVVYQAQPSLQLGGVVSRSTSSLMSVLKVMGQSGLHYQFDGKVLTIQK